MTDALITTYPGQPGPHRSLLEHDFGYLMLITEVLEHWAYRPIRETSFEAPSVLDLIRAVTPLPTHARIWQGTALDEHAEFGPLLVSLSGQQALQRHAATVWMPIGGAFVLDADVDLAALRDHFASLVQATADGYGTFDLSLHPDRLAGWLSALDDDHREAWLGPITCATWRTTIGSKHAWKSVARPAGMARAASASLLALRPVEIERLNAHAYDFYVSGLVNEVHSLEWHASRDVAEVRDWVEGLLVQLDDIYFRDDTVVAEFIRLVAVYPWLLDDERASAIYNNLEESPQGRLRALHALVQQQEAPHE